MYVLFMREDKMEEIRGQLAVLEEQLRTREVMVRNLRAWVNVCSEPATEWVSLLKRQVREAKEVMTPLEQFFPAGPWYVYTLELEDGKYYVGKTTNMQQRLNTHLVKQGAGWTQLYKIVRVLEIVLDDLSNHSIENEKTLEVMMKYGWENVRGGSWTSIELKNAPVKLRKRTGKASEESEEVEGEIELAL